MEFLFLRRAKSTLTLKFLGEDLPTLERVVSFEKTVLFLHRLSGILKKAFGRGDCLLSVTELHLSLSGSVTKLTGSSIDSRVLNL